MIEEDKKTIGLFKKPLRGSFFWVGGGGGCRIGSLYRITFWVGVGGGGRGGGG
jgi:hypothetical protein